MTFDEIKKSLMIQGLVPPTCREHGPYYYSRNGGRAKARAAGLVAQAVRQLARKVDPDAEKVTFPTATWCGSWPRTVQSIELEREGEKAFWHCAKRAGLVQ